MSENPPKKVSFKRRLKHLFTKPLLQIVYIIIPRLYYAYMTLVWYTSKIETYGMEKPVNTGRDKHGSCLCALWHENVFFVAYFFQNVGVSTLASVGQLGELITRMLKLCRFNVFRGGSSKGGKSRKKTILPEMLLYMKRHENVLYGITVDGSSGPRYDTKQGVLFVSREFASPIYCVHIVAKPSFRLPTWDRTQVALPFSRIVVFAEGPYFCPPNATEEDVFQFKAFFNEAMMDNMKRAEHYMKTNELLPPSEHVKPTTEYQESELRPARWLFTEIAYRPTPLKKEFVTSPEEFATDSES